MKRTIVRIDTADTKKTYELPGKGIPQLFEVTMTVRPIDDMGGSSYIAISETLYYERQSFVDATLLPLWKGDKPAPVPPRTLEDMFEEMLQHMGIFPTL